MGTLSSVSSVSSVSSLAASASARLGLSRDLLFSPWCDGKNARSKFRGFGMEGAGGSAGGWGVSSSARSPSRAKNEGVAGKLQEKDKKVINPQLDPHPPSFLPGL